MIPAATALTVAMTATTMAMTTATTCVPHHQIIIKTVAIDQSSFSVHLTNRSLTIELFSKFRRCMKNYHFLPFELGLSRTTKAKAMKIHEQFSKPPVSFIAMHDHYDDPKSQHITFSRSFFETMFTQNKGPGHTSSDSVCRRRPDEA
uniref:Secreted protein n=1 Tax=Romanomermis culicivorax TaxID=13658 RepID=A0A915IYM4_ROMCU